MTGLHAVLFDWGNTLADYPLAGPGAQLSFLSGFLHAIEPLVPGVAGVRESPGAADALRRFNDELATHQVRPLRERLEAMLGERVAPALASEIDRRLCAAIFNAEKPIPSAPAALRAVSDRGLALGVVSNTPWGTSPSLWREHIVRHPLVAGNPPEVAICGDTGYRKPHPSLIATCCEGLGVDPGGVLLVGDNITSDRRAAEAAGCRFVWFSAGRLAPSREIPTIHDLALLDGVLDQI